MKKMKPPSGVTSTKSAKSTEKVKSECKDQVAFKKPAGEQKPDKPLSKTYLSKSHDNLASTLRRKAAAANLASPRPGSTLALTKKDGVKDTPSLREKSSSPGPKFKSPKQTTGHLSKASSTQSIESGSPMKRAQSAQSIDKSGTGQTMNKGTSPVKRAQSTQNISKDRGPTRQRISAPANALQYNAELLASFEKEKKSLERRISELIQIAETRKTELEKLKFENRNLREQIPDESIQDQMELLQSENRHLKDRLQELGVNVEHTTDAEKLSRLQRDKGSQSGDEFHGAVGGESDYGGSSRLHDRALLDADLALSMGDLSCVTPDHPSSLSLDNSNWDRQSNKSSDALSDVACLQDRILQMEETNYSQSEELQATLQELGDLQDTVNELTMENERLADEKSVLLESLCAQTEKLENARLQVEHLKALLVRESENGDRSENERQLVALVKSSHEERDELYLKQIELSNAVHSTENDNRELHDIIRALRDKIQLLEMKNESLLSDKRQMETQINEMREVHAKESIELESHKTQLENERAKVAELEQYRNAADKTEIEALLDNARQEKDKIEAKLTSVTEELGHRNNEVTRLKEHICSLEEELKVTKNNSKMKTSDMEYQLEQKEVEKKEVQQELETLQEHVNQLQVEHERHQEEQKSQSSTMSDMEIQLSAAKQRIRELQGTIREEKLKHREEVEEWKQFQHDLQTAVVIANDIKVEATEEKEKLFSEYQGLIDLKVNLELEVQKLKDELESLKQKEDIRSDLRGRVINTVDRELQALRQGRKLSDTKSGPQSISVKNLIASIEHQVKGPPLSPTSPSQTGSRRNSTDSSIGVSVKTDTPTKTPDRRSSMPVEPPLRSVLRKPAEPKESRPPLSHRHTVGTFIFESSSGSDESTAVSPVKPEADKKPLASILTNKSGGRRNSQEPSPEKTVPASIREAKDPLLDLVKKTGGSKRNALLKWCQAKTHTYSGIDITNFSSSWNDGLAFCALLHSYLPHQIPYQDLLKGQDKKKNFTVAFRAAESVGISSTLSINDMACIERPDWQAVMSYVTSIYKYFEVDTSKP